MSKRAAFIAVAVLGSFLDLYTKALAFDALRDGRAIEVVPGWLRWRAVVNTGIVWGLFPHAGRLFVILSLVAIPVIVLLFWRNPRPRWLFTLAMGLVLAGASGNLYDRCVFAGVRDFIDVFIINYPVFNVADSMICVGVACLAWQMSFGGPAETAAGAAADGAPRPPSAGAEAGRP